jgi:transcriptional regulator with XRE-family HTH domain
MPIDLEKMRSRREKLKLSQADAAEAAGFGGGRQQWSNIETGAKADVAISTLDKVAKALKCKAKDLLK